MKLSVFLKSHIYLFLFFLLVILFFHQFITRGFHPVPSDAMVGLYHPFRDLYAQDYPNGIPFKNFLITDPVRQIIPWKHLSISMLSGFSFPLWNMYEAAGKPLLANFQSSPFYFLNIILIFSRFPFMWSLFVMLQPVLAGIFMYLYLTNLKLDKRAIFLGIISFTFSGFFIAWMEWGTIIHTALWLPLILLSIDKVFYYSQNIKISNMKNEISIRGTENKKLLLWGLIFLFSLVSSFFAGHLQIFFYIFIFMVVYFLVRWFQFGKVKNLLFLFIIINLLFIILTSVQWIPTLQFVSLSARSVDQSDWAKPGWFLPYAHLTQFLAPDFFGNPSTLNYWGTWNYAELVGYVGIIPLFFALLAIMARKDKKTKYFFSVLLVTLIFALPTPISKLPYIYQIPFLSTSQPTRLLFILVFSLSVLASFGLDFFLKNYKIIGKKVLINSVFHIILFSILWIVVFFGQQLIPDISQVNISVAKRNLIFPTILLGIALAIIASYFVLRKNILRKIAVVIFLLVTCIDLFRFASKFMPFSPDIYFFPNTKSLEFLSVQKKPFRIASTDSRIFPPNMSSYYKLESIETYDPLYLLRYAELIAASERGNGNIDPPYGFNRIITPHNIESRIIDLLNVKYVLSLDEIKSEKLIKVFEEGQTKVYENKNVMPRVFFVKKVKLVKNKNEAIQEMFKEDFNARNIAVIEPLGRGYNTPMFNEDLPDGQADIIYYSENKVLIKTSIAREGFLVFTDTFYPTWRTKIYVQDKPGVAQTPYALSLKETGTVIFRTDYNFRGILVPPGNHIIEFYNSLF